jgi:hypothetical protein
VNKILKVVRAEVAGPHSLLVTFNDGVTKQVNLRALLRGLVFEPLLDPACFAQMTVDPAFGVPTWPNDVDLAPEALYALPDERGAA